MSGAVKVSGRPATGRTRSASVSTSPPASARRRAGGTARTTTCAMRPSPAIRPVQVFRPVFAASRIGPWRMRHVVRPVRQPLDGRAHRQVHVDDIAVLPVARDRRDRSPASDAPSHGCPVDADAEAIRGHPGGVPEMQGEALRPARARARAACAGASGKSVSCRSVSPRSGHCRWTP